MYGFTQGMRVMERDFYGVVRTADHPEPVPYRSMYHGGIMHGGQLLGDSFRNTPADYFSPGSGYGRVFTSLREIAPRQKLSVGVIGLGAGVIAAWMRPGDRLVFYEISPRVVEIAQREFTFLADTAARTEVVLGDGRLSLEREPPRGYDVLGIDAFSGDSIPMHLVKRRFKQVDAFTDRPFRGNPVAVVLDAEGLDTAEMQHIARWTNLSETTFLLPSRVADYRLRIFSPTRELPFAGHPTIGSAHAALEAGMVKGRKITQECGAGVLELTVDDGVVFVRSPAVKLTPLAGIAGAVG